MNAPQKILIVEDDVALAHAISINLKARSYEVRTANTASLALQIAGEWSPDLIRNHGSLVSKLDLLHAVWGENYNRETNYLRVYLFQLRQKLEPDPKNPRHFISLPSVGYRFEQ